MRELEHTQTCVSYYRSRNVEQNIKGKYLQNMEVSETRLSFRANLGLTVGSCRSGISVLLFL